MATMIKSPAQQIEAIGTVLQGSQVSDMVAKRALDSTAHYNAVAAKTAPIAPYPPTTLDIDVASLSSTGGLIRIPAGGTAKLTLTGLANWDHTAATLSIRAEGPNMALPILFEKEAPGPKAGAASSYTYPAARTIAFSPPAYIGSLVYRYVTYITNKHTTLFDERLRVDGEGTSEEYLTSDTTTANHAFIGKAVEKITLLQHTPHDETFLLTAILPNVADGLRISRDDDRMLHQVPRKLTGPDTAETADLADVLNEYAKDGQDSATLQIGARTDCVLKITLKTTRQKTASGLEDAQTPEELSLSGWQPTVLSPKIAQGPDATLSLTARITANGAVHANLLETAAPNTRQGVQLPPRVSLLQPFTLPERDAPSRAFSGLWLALSTPPKDAQTLQVQIVPFDPRTQTPGDTLAKANVEISNRQMDLTPIEDGVFAHWVTFDAPLVIDGPDLGKHFALLIGDASGAIPLLESALTRPELGPALYRNFARSDTWAKRDFGQPDKALMFELGEVGDELARAITVQSDGESTTHLFGEATDDLAITLPASAQITLIAAQDTTLEDLTINSTSAPEQLG